MSIGLRVGRDQPGGTLRLNMLHDAGPYKGPHMSPDAMRLAQQYPGDRCTSGNPEGKGASFIKTDPTEWVQGMNQEYERILLSAIKEAAESILPVNKPGKTIKWILDKLRNLFEQQRNDSAPKKDAAPQSSGGIPLGDRGGKKGGDVLYERVDHSPREKDTMVA